MAMQKVNLYLPELRPRREWLTLQTVVICVVFYFLFMLFTLKVTTDDVKNLEQIVKTKENAKVASETRLEKYRNMTKSINVALMDDEIADLRMQVAARQQIRSVIEGQRLGNETGFSQNLQSLARQSLPSISLNRIRLTRGGQYVEMQGETLSPEDIAYYIELLQSEKSFGFSRFGSLSVGKQKHANRHVFALGFDSLYQIAIKEK
ncbi:hypothetical protein TDB9533_02404 [Thalassocella blandensis]|nr:hypothetical protein TDB9533_02404 [Thalassocella blandensis]